MSHARLFLMAGALSAASTPSWRNRRSAPRHFAGDQRMACRLPDGTSLFVRVLDRSVDGVSVDSPRRPPVGSEIFIGRTRSVIVRHTLRGFVAVYRGPGEAVAQPPRLRAVPN